MTNVGVLGNVRIKQRGLLYGSCIGRSLPGVMHERLRGESVSGWFGDNGMLVRLKSYVIFRYPGFCRNLCRTVSPAEGLHA